MEIVSKFFTEFLPKKLENDPSLAESIDAVYQFNLGEAGNWIVDLTSGGGVTAGDHEDPGCVVTAEGADFAKLLENPGQAMMLFTMGKLKVSNMSLGMALSKLLG